ncbi:MAG: hypothetical protein JSV94_05205 [Methanobacteriota archaeon]|nr:MAG: hypothetical protein JSV94_05205 [Euryarchaeota archaeon]
MCEVQLFADVHPTEGREKVATAMTRLFPDAVIEGDRRLVGRSRSVETFSERLAKQKIRAAARKILLRGASGSETRFRLNKQVATAGKVSFSEESHPLGDLHVVIRSQNLQGLIDAIAPVFQEDDR